MQPSILDDLLAVGAIHLSPDKPFQWASGWLSPIYCDNRRALSSHEARQKIIDGMLAIIAKEYPNAEAIVGVATGAIAIGALVAHSLKLPFAYVRPKPKEHGLGNQIEGWLREGANVVVVEDLISTGGSSLGAIEALRAAGVQVMGMVAIFTYDFPQAKANLERAAVTCHTLESYPHLVELLAARGELDAHTVSSLNEWRQAPEMWGKAAQ